MDLSEIAEQLGEVKAQCEANKEQISLLQKSTAALNEIATSVKLIASRQGDMGEKLDKVVTKVDELEQIPAKRWNAVVEKILLTAVTVIVTALVTYALTRIGLGGAG